MIVNILNVPTGGWKIGNLRRGERRGGGVLVPGHWKVTTNVLTRYRNLV